jgi:hypothetical protein
MKERAAVRLFRAIVLLGLGRAGLHVVAEALGVVGVGVEDGVLV